MMRRLIRHCPRDVESLNQVWSNTWISSALIRPCFTASCATTLRPSDRAEEDSGSSMDYAKYSSSDWDVGVALSYKVFDGSFFTRCGNSPNANSGGCVRNVGLKLRA